MRRKKPASNRAVFATAGRREARRSVTDLFEPQEMASPSSALPIVPAMSASLEPGEARRLREIAARIVESQPALVATHAFGAAVRSGMGASLWLLIGDAREIALAEGGESTTYEYRLSLLAREGDLVAFGRETLPEFMRYRAEKLGLEPIVSLSPRSGPREQLLPLAERCRLDREVFSRIAEQARSAGGLTILPHIGMGSAWRLGAAVAGANPRDRPV
jgi:Pre ATP-grasp domain